jgi:hypothetical protein
VRSVSAEAMRAKQSAETSPRNVAVSGARSKSDPSPTSELQDMPREQFKRSVPNTTISHTPNPIAVVTSPGVVRGRGENQAVVTTGSLGCSKCRYAVNGCKKCRPPQEDQDQVPERKGSANVKLSRSRSKGKPWKPNDSAGQIGLTLV